MPASFQYTGKQWLDALQALEEKELHLRLFMQSSSDFVWNWDMLANTVERSIGYEQVFGYSEQEVTQNIEWWYERLHPEDSEKIFREFDNACANGDNACSLEYRFRSKDGSFASIIDQVRLIRDETGQVVRCIGAMRDVSEFKQAQEALQKSERKHRSLFETMELGIVYKNPDGSITDANPAAERIFGLSLAQMQGKEPCDPRWKMLREDRSEFPFDEYPTTQAARTSKPVHNVIMGMFHPESNETRWAQVSATPQFRPGEDRPFQVYATFTDITDIKDIKQTLEVNEQRLQSVMQVTGEGIWDWDLSNNIVLHNQRWCELLGYGEEMLRHPVEKFAEILHADDREIVMARIQACLAENQPYYSEHRMYRADGQIIWVLDRGDIFNRDTQGKPLRMIGCVADISERKLAEESMRMAASIYQSSTEAIMVTNDQNCIVDINPAFTQITGYTLAEVKGKNPNILQSDRHTKIFYQEMWQAITDEGHWQGELWDRHKNGNEFAIWSSISVIRHPDGSVYRYLAQFSDITEKKQKDELIWTQANYDVLTKLPNRRLLTDRLEQEIKKAHRHKLAMALLFIDLDRFKEINDTLGHAKGDLLLVEAARRISGCVRETDTIGRLGGDEFTAILPEFGDRLHVDRIAQQIIDKLSQPFYFKNDSNGYYISASIGITLYPDDALDIGDLLKHADQAMYQAKESGRQCFSYFTQSMQQEAQEKLALTHDLRQALARQELHVYYQPIIELASGRIVKSEALLRWKHSERGLISPAVFIPLAEESGLIHEIGEWVFRQSIQCVDKIRQQTGRIVPVSVNKSPVQFEFTSQEAAWPDKLAQLGLPGSSITVEITEGLLLKKSSKTKQSLLDYRNSGIEVSIDDFGTGFSSLSYLKKFDIDYLKIDRSFISKLIEDESDKVLTEAIIVMAHKLGIQTIAEGVETVEQRDLLKTFDCDHAQGFLYSPAVATEEFEGMLKNQ